MGKSQCFGGEAVERVSFGIFVRGYVCVCACMWGIGFNYLDLYSQRFLEFFLELHLSLRKIIC